VTARCGARLSELREWIRLLEEADIREL